MHKAVNLVVKLARSSMGYPVALENWIADTPTEYQWITLAPTSPAIHHERIVPWHDFGEDRSMEYWRRRPRGVMRGWAKSRGGHYESTERTCQALAELGQCKTIEPYELDIAMVDGMGASKSDLEDYNSMATFAEQCCSHLITPLTDDQLRTNLAWDEVRIMRPGGSDYFSRYAWDGRIFLNNSGGSHHFAAAQYIACKLGRKVPLIGRLYDYSLDKQAVDALGREFEVFALPDNNPAVSNAFHDGMASFGATYFRLPLPRGHQSAQAILLPKSEDRSRQVATLLREGGAFDFAYALRQWAYRPLLQHLISAAPSSRSAHAAAVSMSSSPSASG